MYTSSKQVSKILLIVLPISFLVLFTLSSLILVINNSTQQHIHIHKHIQIKMAHSTCEGTLYPQLCISTLSTFPDLHKRTVPQMISHVVKHAVHDVRASFKTCTVIRKHLRHRLAPLDKRALQDCLQLFNHTVSELRIALSDLSRKYPSEHYHDIQTLLSAAMTNQYTCLDGFAYSQANVRDYIQDRLFNISRHVSNSLAMLNKIPGVNTSDDGVFPEYGKLEGGFPTWLTRIDRRLLQTPVNATWYDLVVAKDGTGNFTTIGEAVAAAPSKSETRFVIYIKEGAYFENVEVERKKTMLMFVGDGIGKTWVKGNRSVVDGWTTFQSATMGEFPHYSSFFTKLIVV
ncbi:probable pectinesterase/pectinesterase inhibitor 40 [Cornus florida]|uniref:probable pectinesterase/pectinesterase inhibitor 40 n=1 Tax=Cornus florida TaxID=4283 RepID=UPI0028975CA9|nr:probable pectinesterase/pectinesterase inhibitor 40 [Cornus florida]